MGEWRDISDAPRDGTDVDLWVVNQRGEGERVADAYWDGDLWIDPYGNYGDGGPVENLPSEHRPWTRRATHWMLPPGPPA